MTTTDTLAAFQVKDSAALARGNAVLAELGFAPFEDIAALSGGLNELKLEYKTALDKLARVQWEIAHLRRLTMGEARKHVLDMLGLYGPLWEDLLARHVIVANPGLDEEDVCRAVGRAVWSLDQDKYIIRCRDGWELVGDDPDALRHHWRR
ncbi:MAG: hypothetical protein P4L83_10510 [Nevskia sp.]|nr:hypothetical protein [Nevskia sp.]